MPDPLPCRDGLIAATALVQNLVVVTRNLADFQASGLKRLNPLAAALILLGRRVQPQGSRPALRQRSQRGIRDCRKPPGLCG